MFRSVVSAVALVLVGFAGDAGAQTTSQQQPAVSQQPAARPAASGQQQRRRERPAGQTTQTRPAGQNAQARTAGQPGQQPARQSGGLNLDLNGGGTSVNGATRRPGDAFAVSGPYATDAQMQRYTGRRTVQMPRAPIQMFQSEENDTVTGFRR